MTEKDIEATIYAFYKSKQNDPKHPWTREVSKGFLLAAQHDGVLTDASKGLSDDALIRECARVLAKKTVSIFLETQIREGRQGE